MSNQPELPAAAGQGRRVAVIAIHGVGEHAPGEMAAAVAEQLLTVCADSYSEAQSSRVTVECNTSELGLTSVGPDAYGQYSRQRLRAGFRSGFLSRQQRLADQEKRGDASIDQKFTTALLTDGADYRATYATSCHTLRRDADGTAVDIHELHWSDLSHGSVTGGIRVFDQFTQLLLHVASLGRTTLATLLASGEDAGRTDHTRLLYRLSALVYWLLAMPIVQGNLLFILLACLIFPGVASAGVLKMALVIAIGGGIAFAMAAQFRRHFSAATPDAREQSSGIQRVAVPLSLFAGLAGGALVWAGWPGIEPVAVPLAAMLEAIGLLWIGTLLMKRYDQSRPGALLLWFVLASALTVTGVGLALLPPEMPGHVSAMLNWLGHLTEIVYVSLTVAWLTLILFNGALLLAAIRFLLVAKPSDQARRAVATALIAASLPAPLLLAVVLALWAAAYHVFQNILPTQPFFPWFGTLFPGVCTLREFVEALIANSATQAFVPYLLLMALAGLLVAWGLLPSIKAELLPPRPESRPVEPAEPQTRSLKRWLDGAFDAMRLAAVLAGAGFFLLLPYGAIAPLVDWPTVAFSRLDIDWMVLVGELVGGTAVGFLAGTRLFARSFSNFFGRWRVAVDAALDVDNWLRERPRGNTPRLRIFARFNGLLQHLRAGNYDSIVIVSHSQGTVVATDFLRYLRHRVPERLAELPPIHLLTMGSPLRQLYAWRFPFLYAWASAPAGQAGPLPDECGVARWINIYGSGDYVGRNLWTSADRAAEEPPRTAAAAPRDVCLGPQAHTHYFDRDQTVVGRTTDELISAT